MELLIPLKAQSEIPLYEQIYSYIKEEIRRGNLRSSRKLPSTRVLAENLKVSRSTAQMAYDQLVSEGYIEAVPCRGFFVSNIEELVEAGQGKADALVLKELERQDKYQVDFSPRGIDLNSFPFNTWRKISKGTLTDDNKEMFLTGSSQGEPGLREAIREYLHSARGVNCSREQIVIGAGSEYLLMLLNQILGPEHRIAMENPTYKQAWRVFTSLGYQVEPVEMDQYGMDLELLLQSNADIAYIMPSHQYPTGIVMPVKRRQELLSWAYQEESRYLIEDDYDSEFRYKGKPIPALQGMDNRGRVIYMGTFSKSIAPAIRISFLVLPKPLLHIYYEKVSFYASTVSRIDQNILFTFLAEGHYERHLNRMRAIYKAKHDALLTALKPLEDIFHIRGEYAGLHVLLTHKGGVDERWLLEQAETVGVRVYGLSGYYIPKRDQAYPPTVVLGYANLTEKEICLGICLLSKVWRKPSV